MAPITLATLPHATEQQVFDQVVRHLLGQRATSYGDGIDAGCAYRGARGLRCAAGCLIADDEYQADLMEGEAWELLVRKGMAPSAHEVLIQRLQFIHDEHSPEAWRDRLQRAAGNFGLTMPPEFA